MKNIEVLLNKELDQDCLHEAGFVYDWSNSKIGEKVCAICKTEHSQYSLTNYHVKINWLR